MIIENFAMEKASAGYTIQNHIFFSAAHQLCAIGTYWRQLSKKICLWFKDKQVFSKLSKGLFFHLLRCQWKNPKRKSK